MFYGLTSLRREAQQVCLIFQTTAATRSSDRKQLKWKIGNNITQDDSLPPKNCWDRMEGMRLVSGGSNEKQRTSNGGVKKQKVAVWKRPAAMMLRHYGIYALESRNYPVISYLSYLSFSVTHICTLYPTTHTSTYTVVIHLQIKKKKKSPVPGL